MSIVICEQCERQIDSDYDCDCFVGPPAGMCNAADQAKFTTVLCESCREAAYDNYQQYLAETGGGPTLQEQQQVAWRLK